MQRPPRDTPLGVALAVLGVLHPMVFAAAFVLDRFAITNTAIPELTRPLLLAVAGAGVFTLLLWVVLRNRYWAALVATTLLLIVVIHPIPALVMVTLVTWWAAVTFMRRRRGPVSALRSDHLPVRIASAYAVVLLAGGLVSSVGAFTTHIEDPPRLRPPDGTGGPNIYLLLLDGYPRSDTLADLGYDNGPFEAELEHLGFSISRDAQSNHNKTWLTVASMLHADYVADIPEIAEPPDAAPAQVRLAHDLINRSAVLEHLRGRGYEVISIPSSVLSTDVTTAATVWASRHLNQFEIALVSASLPAFLVPQSVLDLLVGDMRGQVHDQLAALVEAARNGEGRSQVVLAHLMAPHPPFILGQAPDYLRDCFPGCKVWETTLAETRLSRGEYASRLGTQVDELNRQVLGALEQIVGADPKAVVLVVSDHGARLETDAEDEHFRILFAARATDHRHLFDDDQAPVNVFRRILGGLFDLPLDDVVSRRWVSDWTHPLNIRPADRARD